MLHIDVSNAPVQTGNFTGELSQAHTWLQEASGRGNDFVGWVNLPRDYDKEEYARIQAAAKKIQSDSKALVVIGIGGSYLGARAAIELIRSNNYNLIKKDTPNIYFSGNGLSSDAMQEVIDLLGDDDFSVNVISKSGTTTEPAVAFRFFKARLEEKYGKAGAAGRIYATTDKARGALKSLATAEGYETFVVPDLEMTLTEKSLSFNLWIRESSSSVDRPLPVKYTSGASGARPSSSMTARAPR